MDPNKFHDQAITALEDDAGTWHCMKCWASAVGLTSAEDVQRLRLLARTFLNQMDPMARQGGFCDKGQHGTDDFIVRVLPRQWPAVASVKRERPGETQSADEREKRMRREARIREKLKSGALPRGGPRLLRLPGVLPVESNWRIGTGPAGPCSGCDEEISHGEVYSEFQNPSGQMIRFHEACVGIWEKERHRAQTGDAGERRD